MTKNKKYVEHIIKDGARYHVLSYFGIEDENGIIGVERCSEPNCERNKRYDTMVEEGKIK